MKTITFFAIALSLLLFSCNSEPTLQKFFVENSEKPNFITLDISPSILNIDSKELTEEQRKALQSFDKMNIIAFRSNQQNQTDYEAERQKLITILKDEQYQQLMKIGSGKEGASISFVGQEDKIDEFIFYANKKENGFAVVRVLGKDMNTNNIMTLLSVLQKSKIDMEQLKPLQNFVK